MTGPQPAPKPRIDDFVDKGVRSLIRSLFPDTPDMTDVELRARAVAGFNEWVTSYSNQSPSHGHDASAFFKGIGVADIDSWSVTLRGAIRDILKAPAVRETAEILGTLISEPFVAVMEEYAAKDDFSGPEMASAFHGMTTLVTLPSIILKAMKGDILGLAFGDIGGALAPLYWNLGLGFLGWQTLAPLLSAGLQPKLERHYNKLYRPKRYGLSDLLYFYYAGEYTLAEFNREASELGWREKDIRVLPETLYRSPSPSDLKLLYDAGILDNDSLEKELIKTGHNPRYVPTLAAAVIHDESTVDKGVSVSSLKKAYREGLRTRAEFLQLMRLLGYTFQAIELELDILDNERETEARKLSMEQVHKAYLKNIVQPSEVLHFLLDLTYPLTDAQTILKTWNAEKAPKVLRVNQGTIIAAFKNGVLSETETYHRLAEVGYTNDDIALLIENAKVGAGRVVKTLSLSHILSAYAIGAISEVELKTRLTNYGALAVDIPIYIKLAKFDPFQKTTIEDIEQAAKLGVIDKARSIDMQLALGIDRTTAELRATTWQTYRDQFKPRLSAGTLAVLYKQAVISKDELTRGLKAIGFKDSDVTALVRSADLAFPRELIGSEIKEIYLSGVIDRGRAVSLLVKSGLSQENANLSADAWDKTIARAAPRPSIQQYLSAFRNDLLTEAELITKLRELGLGEDAIAFYLRTLQAPEVEVTESLTKTDILGLYGDELMTFEQALERLINSGYSADDATLLLKRKTRGIADSQVHSLFMNGYINPDEYYAILINLGYEESEIEAYLMAIGF